MQKTNNAIMQYTKIIFVMSLILLADSKIIFAQAFTHPGILNNQNELDFIKDKIKKGEQPWKNAFDRLKASPYSALTYTARPKATTDCGSYNKDKNGNTVPECKTFVEDAMAAYSASLMWYFTEDKQYATQAIKLINAWSNVYVSNEGSNARLNVSWAAPWYANAAELLKYGNSGGGSGWAAGDMQKFESMLNKFLPYVKDETMPGNNWIQSAIEAHFAIAIYTNNRTEFNSAVSRWKTRVKTYIYQTTDGPISTKFKSAPINGVCMETARDLGHMKLGINSMLYAAQSAYEQGTDLFTVEQKRLTDCLELHGSWMTGAVAVPQGVNGGVVLTRENQPSTAIRPPNGGGGSAFEIAYNHLNGRLKKSLPYTKRMIDSNRPASAGQWVFKWETLTHGNLPFNFTPPNPCANNTLPVAGITSPLSNASFTAGSSVTVTANASDNGTVTAVEFFDGTVSLGTDNTAPYSFVLSNAASKNYSIKAVATDNCGAKGSSTVVTFTVQPAVNEPPQVNFTAPQNNSQVNAGTSVVVRVNASDADGIANVKLYVQNVLVRQDNTAPYDWNTSGQDAVLQNMAAGTYSLKAVATDTKGAVKETIISLVVKAIVLDPCAGIAKPTISLTSPVANSSFNEGQSIALSANAASAASGITKVEFYDGATLLNTDVAAPYSFSTSALSVGTHSVSAKATDNCGNSTTSAVLTVTVKKLIATNDPILGASCGVKNQTVTFDLNPAYTTNATAFSWWFTGSSESVTPGIDSKSASVKLSQYFSSGEVCVGVNLSTAPYYVQYCKPVAYCAAREGYAVEKVSSGSAENSVRIFPNPASGNSLTIDASGISENPTEILILNKWSETVLSSKVHSSISSLSIHELPAGIYTIKINYATHSLVEKLVVSGQ